jgi:hypothetical protein
MTDTNDPHPAFVNTFLSQAGITQGDTVLNITTALQSGSEEDALHQYMTALVRMPENTYAGRFVM